MSEPTMAQEYEERFDLADRIRERQNQTFRGELERLVYALDMSEGVDIVYLRLEDALKALYPEGVPPWRQ